MTFSKRLASATLQLTLSNAAVRLLALITMPLLTSLLSPEAYGAASMLGTLIALISVVALCGMDMSYARAYHAKESPSGKMVEAFVWRYTIGAGVVASIVAALAWLFVIADRLQLQTYLAGFLSLGIFFSITNAMSQARARLNNRYRSMSLAIVASAISSVAISLGIALLWSPTELPLVFSLVAGFLVPVLILGAPDIGTLLTPSGLSSNERTQVLKIGLAGIITAPMYWVISSLDRWYLGYFEDPASVGIYSIGYSVAIMGMMVNNAVTSVWFPEASRAFEQNPEEAQIELGNLAERLIVALGLVWLAITAAGADAVRLLANQRFHEACEVIPYIAGGVFFHGFLHLANAGTLLKKKLHHTIWWWLGGAFVCLTLNSLLVPEFSRLGAAITQTCSFAFVALGIYFSAQRVFPLKIRVLRLLSTLSMVALAGFVMQNAWATTPLYSLLIKLPVGLGISWLVLNAMAPDILGYLRHRVCPTKSFQG